VRRSKNARPHSHSHLRSKKNRCWFGRKLLCHWSKGWRKWVRLFCFRSAKVRRRSSRAGSKPNRIEEDESRSRSCITQEEDESEERETGKEVCSGIASASTPPKNALLLTRCRSAPYRSSSLACRLWGEEQQENGEQTFTKDEREKGAVSLLEASEMEPGARRDSASETRANGSDIGSEREEKQEEEEQRRPPPPLVMLMRSRSEPVRGGSERLDPLTSEFWRERRLSDYHTSTAHSCTPHAVD